jgi:hypothetical protein
LEKKTRTIALIILFALGAGALAWAWWPASAPQVDSAIVETAAEAARQAQQNQPPQPEEPKREGKAKPGAFGSPGH